MSASGPCQINQFTWPQKIAIRFCLYGFFAIGVAGIFLESIPWGIGYLLCMALVPVVVLRCFCSHCPYPYTYGTCLGMPPAIVRLFGHKPGKPSVLETLAFFFGLAVSLAVPQYFLWQRPPLMVVYWVLGLPACIAFPFYFCRRCRYVHCPFHPWMTPPGRVGGRDEPPAPHPCPPSEGNRACGFPAHFGKTGASLSIRHSP